MIRAPVRALPPFSRRACSPLLPKRRSHRRAFTLIEMLTTVAVLIIVLGLMVSLARHVRDQSANQLTADLLRKLDVALRKYADRNGGQLPQVEPIIGDGEPVSDEIVLQHRARRNNEQFVHALREYFTAAHAPDKPPAAKNAANSLDPAGSANNPDATDIDASGEFGELPVSIYDEVTLRDAWGAPIVFMAHDNAAIGMASRDHPSFFFSAGPDHRYLTRDDNLYSYEAAR